MPNTKNNEWYTPSHFIEAARLVMGSIDVDPASCAKANETVGATEYYTKEDNGLLHEWHGNIWLNPPYGHIEPEKTGSTKGYQQVFMSKLLTEYKSEHTYQAIVLLLGNAPMKRWFAPFEQFPLSFCSDAINWRYPDGSRAKFGFGSIFLYLGPYRQRFVDVFSEFGTVYGQLLPYYPHIFSSQLTIPFSS